MYKLVLWSEAKEDTCKHMNYTLFPHPFLHSLSPIPSMGTICKMFHYLLIEICIFYIWGMVNVECGCEKVVHARVTHITK